MSTLLFESFGVLTYFCLHIIAKQQYPMICISLLGLLYIIDNTNGEAVEVEEITALNKVCFC